jgi:hypothetical protein
MKKYTIFLEKYLEVEEEKERLAFLRGYMLNLTPKQFLLFWDRNVANGIAAIKELALAHNDTSSIEEVTTLAQRLKNRYTNQEQTA